MTMKFNNNQMNDNQNKIDNKHLINIDFNNEK